MRAWKISWFMRSPTGATPRRPAERITWRDCAAQLAKSGARIVTVIGRYFAMDRDRRWDRTKLAWDAIVLGRGEICHDDAGGGGQPAIRGRQNG